MPGRKHWTTSNTSHKREGSSDMVRCRIDHSLGKCDMCNEPAAHWIISPVCETKRCVAHTPKSLKPYIVQVDPTVQSWQSGHLFMLYWEHTHNPQTKREAIQNDSQHRAVSVQCRGKVVTSSRQSRNARTVTGVWSSIRIHTGSNRSVSTRDRKWPCRCSVETQRIALIRSRHRIANRMPVAYSTGIFFWKENYEPCEYH